MLIMKIRNENVTRVASAKREPKRKLCWNLQKAGFSRTLENSASFHGTGCMWCPSSRCRGKRGGFLWPVQETDRVWKPCWKRHARTSCSVTHRSGVLPHPCPRRLPSLSPAQGGRSAEMHPVLRRGSYPRAPEDDGFILSVWKCQNHPEAFLWLDSLRSGGSVLFRIRICDPIPNFSAPFSEYFILEVEIFKSVVNVRT